MANINNSVSYFFKLFPGGLFISLLFLCACSNRNEQRKMDVEPAQTVSEGKSSIEYAIGFDISHYDDYKILRLFSHYNESSDTLNYVLKSKEVEIAPQFRDYRQIITPVKKIALLHSSYLPFFNFCGAIDQLSAISEAKYIYDDDIYSKVQNGELPEVGYGESLDREKLLSLGIELVVTVGFPNAPNKSSQLLEELGIPVLVFSDWQETNLLGRMEWVKLLAELTGNEESVDIRFKAIEKQYHELLSISKEIKNKPTIITNLPFKGSWYVPGGNSYVSNLLDDAGATYLWSDDKGTGGIQLDFESVYAKGINAEYWISPDFAQSKSDILDKDERLADFNSFKRGKIFNNNKRVSRGTANDYWESGIINPHIILADMIKILHPELLPDHQLFYYHQLY